jgi:hypothetical protein
VFWSLEAMQGFQPIEKAIRFTFPNFKRKKDKIEKVIEEAFVIFGKVSARSIKR